MTDSRSGEPGGDKYEYDFKDALTLIMALSQRAHNAWSAYVAGALIVGGWILTNGNLLGWRERGVVIAAVIAGTLLNLFTTVKIHRLFNAVVREATEAAEHAKFWKPESMREAIKQLTITSPRTVVFINIAIAVLLTLAAALLNFKYDSACMICN